MKGAKRPMVICGQGIFDREDGAQVHSAIRNLCDSLECEEGWNPFNMLQKSAATTGALDLGYQAGVDSIKQNKPKVVFLMGADEGVVGPDDVSQLRFFENILISRRSSNETYTYQSLPRL